MRLFHFFLRKERSNRTKTGLANSNTEPTEGPEGIIVASAFPKKFHCAGTIVPLR